jgi:hypothetical protein
LFQEQRQERKERKKERKVRMKRRRLQGRIEGTRFPRSFTVLCSFLQDPTDDSIFRELYLKLMRADDGNFPATTLSGLQRVCSTNFAFIAIPENVMPLLKHVNCSVIPLPYKTYPISLAMAFSPRSPYTDFWNYRRVRPANLLA